MQTVHFETATAATKRPKKAAEGPSGAATTLAVAQSTQSVRQVTNAYPQVRPAVALKPSAAASNADSRCMAHNQPHLQRCCDVTLSLKALLRCVLLCKESAIVLGGLLAKQQ